MPAQVYYVAFRKETPWELSAACDICGVEHRWQGNDIARLWKAVKEWGWIASTGWFKAKLVKCPDCLDQARGERRRRAKQRGVEEARGAVAGPLPGNQGGEGIRPRVRDAGGMSRKNPPAFVCGKDA